MKFPYEETETETETVIRYTGLPFLYLSAALVLVLSFVPNEVLPSFVTGSISFILFAAVLVMWILYLKPRRQIVEAMKAGSVELSGSRFSFKNPITYRIKKTL